MLKDHQLKGIFLSQLRLKDAQKRLKTHTLRDRLIMYLFKRTEKDREVVGIDYSNHIDDPPDGPANKRREDGKEKNKGGKKVAKDQQ